jgi:hypothetical protein
MSSNRNSIGNAGAITLATVTAAAVNTGPVDSGPLLYQVHTPGTQPYDYSLIRACSQLMIGVGGTATGMSTTWYFTTDVPTANGTSASPIWFVCPSPSTEAGSQWANPTQNIPGLNVLEFKGRAIAIRGVTSLTVPSVPATGSLTQLLLAGF